MHHYQLHIGDTLLAIGHLPPAHQGIYRALQDRYKHKEFPLPDDLDKLAEWVNARTRRDRDALQDVLDEFFELREDGCWHLDDWNDEISEYQRNAPARATSGADRKAKSAARLLRLRAEHLRRRNALAARGVTAPARMSMPKLRALCVKHLGAAESDALSAAPAAGPAKRMETHVETGETPPHEPPPIPQQPPTPGPAGETVGGGGEEDETPDAAGGETPVETGNASPMATGVATALPSALQPERVHAVAAELTKGGVPVSADDKTLQAYVLAGWTAELLLAKKPAAGWDSLRAPWGWLKTRLSNEAAAPPAAVVTAPVATGAPGASTSWTESRKGIEDRGEELGLGRWSESEWEAGRMESWPVYRGKVLKAAGVAKESKAC